MNFFFDFFPIILFFGAFKLYNIFIATAVAIVSTFAQLLYSRLKTGKFNKTHVISFFSILILGGATIFFHNEVFIKWKTTVVYWILSLVFLITGFSNKTLMQHLTDNTIEIPKKVWKKLNYSWVGFFALMGGANLYVAYNFSTDMWVNFKLFGTLGLTIVFFLIQCIFIAKAMKESKAN